MIANPDATRLLENLDFIIIDEITELIDNKRGDLLALSLSRINSINKKINLIGMSATINNFSYLKKWFSFNGTTKIVFNKLKKKLILKFFTLVKYLLVDIQRIPILSL